MKSIRLLLASMLISCASSTDSIEHTVVVKGDKAASFAAGDSPELLSLSLEELYVGENANCSDLKVVRRLKNGNGVATEFYNNPEAVVISARPESPEIIRCVAVRLSDIVTFTPNDQAVNNIASCSDQSYSVDVFTGGFNHDLEGNSTAGSGSPGSNDKQSIYLIFSIAAPSFSTDGSQTFVMSQALDTQNPYDIILYADYEGKVVDASGNCSLNGFQLGMRQGDFSLTSEEEIFY